VTFSTGEPFEVRADQCAWQWDTVTYNTAPAPGAVLATKSSDPVGWNEIVIPASALPANGGKFCVQITKSGSSWGNLASISYPNARGAELVMHVP
jgi:hypothetical protein